MLRKIVWVTAVLVIFFAALLYLPNISIEFMDTNKIMAMTEVVPTYETKEQAISYKTEPVYEEQVVEEDIYVDCMIYNATTDSNVAGKCYSTTKNRTKNVSVGYTMKPTLSNITLESGKSILFNGQNKTIKEEYGWKCQNALTDGCVLLCESTLDGWPDGIIQSGESYQKIDVCLNVTNGDSLKSHKGVFG